MSMRDSEHVHCRIFKWVLYSFYFIPNVIGVLMLFTCFESLDFGLKFFLLFFSQNQPISLLPHSGIRVSQTPVLSHYSAWLHSCLCQSLSRVRLFATPWGAAHQGPLSMGFSRQEYWSGLPFPSPGYLPNPGIKPTSLVSPSLTGGFFTTRVTWEAQSVSHSIVSNSL